MAKQVDLLLVDGLNLIRRVHAGLPGAEPGAEAIIETCLRSLRRALGEAAPSHAACVLDGQGPTWRHALDPGYKAGRKPMPEAVRAALPLIRSGFAGAGVTSLEVATTEADDVIATLAHKVAARGGRVQVLSTDRAFYSLLAEGIGVRDHFARRDLSRAYVVERLGVEPEQLVDLWALSGFATSGIAGVPGIGPKTAVRLLGEHGDLEHILASASRIGGRVGRALVDGADRARRAQALLRLRSDVAVGVNLKDLRREG